MCHRHQASLTPGFALNAHVVGREKLLSVAVSAHHRCSLALAYSPHTGTQQITFFSVLFYTYFRHTLSPKCCKAHGSVLALRNTRQKESLRHSHRCMAPWMLERTLIFSVEVETRGSQPASTTSMYVSNPTFYCSANA